MIFGSVCSGIEATSVAWVPLGWQCAWVSEIEPFPNAVLQHHYPEVPNHGDFTKINQPGGPRADGVQLLCGGTPCQSFSVAGLRAGLDDPRGNLALEYLALADRLRPRWLVWENVPGILSSTSHGAADPRPPADPMDLGFDGQEMETEEEYDSEELHAFNCFLAGLSSIGYGFAYRVLDAQYFGLAQRRRRVFVVGHLGSWQRAAAVLFESASLSWNPAPSRETASQVAAPITSGVGRRGKPSGRRQEDDVNLEIQCHGSNVGPMGALRKGNENAGPDEAAASHIVAAPLLGKDNSSHDESMETYVTHALRAEGFDASEDGTGGGTPLVAHALNARNARNDGTVETFVIKGANSNAKETHAHESDTATALDSHGAGGIAGQGGTVARDGPVAFEARYARNGRGAPSDVCPPLKAESGQTGKGDSAPLVAATLNSGANKSGGTRTPGTSADTAESLIPCGLAVRRLTPRECERLQGFGDDYTLIPNYRGKIRGPLAKDLAEELGITFEEAQEIQPAMKAREIEEMAEYLDIPLKESREIGITPDGPRYRALGNSMAVPVMRWIGERIQLVEDINA